MPLVLGFDFAGTVVKTGSRVTRFKVGDEVYGLPRRTMVGTFAQFFAVKAEDIALKPKNLDFEQAASVPLVGLTTYQAFNELMGLRSGERVLIQAGAGGIGTFAIQLAKVIAGAYVATTASERGRALVERLGADEVIDYRAVDFWKVLHGYDCLYDVFGGKSLDEVQDPAARRARRVAQRHAQRALRQGAAPGLLEDRGLARSVASPHPAREASA